MRSIVTQHQQMALRHQHQQQHQHQHAQQPRMAQMVLVNTPQGMGWVHPSALGQQAPQPTPGAGAVGNTFKTLLIVGGLSFAGYWAWKKWGGESMGSSLGEPSAKEGGGYVKSRRRRRSRSRLMSEFKQFLDNNGANEMEELEECAPYGATGDDVDAPAPESEPDEDEDTDADDEDGDDEEGDDEEGEKESD